MQAAMFLEMAAGYFAVRVGLLKSSGEDFLTDMIVNITLPLQTIAAFAVKFGKDEFSMGIQIILVSVAYQIVVNTVAHFAYNRFPKERKPIFQYGTVCSNAGILGSSIANWIYGHMGLLFASLFVIPQRIVIWSAGLSYYTEAPGLKTIVKKLLIHPCVIAVEIGLVLMIFQLPVPAFLMNTMEQVGDCTGPLIMIYLGMVLARCGLGSLFDPMAFFYASVRLIFIPLFVFSCVRFLPLTVTAAGVMVVETAMPAGSTTAILAGKYGADVRFATSCVVVSTFFSILLLPLWVFLVQYSFGIA